MGCPSLTDLDLSGNTHLLALMPFAAQVAEGLGEPGLVKVRHLHLCEKCTPLDHDLPQLGSSLRKLLASCPDLSHLDVSGWISCPGSRDGAFLAAMTTGLPSSTGDAVVAGLR